MDRPQSRSIVELLPVEVLERITEYLPASSRRDDCLSLLRVSKQWYGPAIRSLFSFVVLDNEAHAQGVLDTLRQDAAAGGALHTVVRKLCLLIGPEDAREASPEDTSQELAQQQQGQPNQPAPPMVPGHAALPNYVPQNHGTHPAGPPVHPLPQGPFAPAFQAAIAESDDSDGDDDEEGFLFNAPLGHPLPLHQQHHQHQHAPAVSHNNVPAILSSFVTGGATINPPTHAPIPPAALTIPQMPEFPAQQPVAMPAAGPHNDAAAQLLAIQAYFLQVHPHHAHFFPPAASTLAQTMSPQDLHQAALAQLPPPPLQAPVPAPPTAPATTAEDAAEDDEEPVYVASPSGKTPLHLRSAVQILERTRCLQALVFMLPKQTPLRRAAFTPLLQLPLLRKLELGGQVQFAQLWDILRSSPNLSDLSVTGLVEGDKASAIMETECLRRTFHLHTVSLIKADLPDRCLHFLLQSTHDSLRELKLSRLSGCTRAGLRHALQIVGTTLRRLALHRATFARGVAADDTALMSLMDILPQVCPLLEELQLATDKVCSERHFLPTILPSLFLTTLELDYKTPAVLEHQLLAMITGLPAGRMEAFCLGPNLAHLATPKVIRACQEIGITVLSTTS